MCGSGFMRKLPFTWHSKFILDRMQRKTSRADSCISQNSLLPLPAALSHLYELLVQSEMLMTLIISFNSKQFISHVFLVVLNLLPWVCFASFHRATVLTMFVLLLRFVLQSRKACLLEFSQIYLQCNHALHGLPRLAF